MRTKCLLLALVVILAFGRGGVAREWTSIDGEHRIEADLVGFDSKQVRLKKADGTIVVVPLKQLGDADRQWMAEIVQRQEAAKAVLVKKGLRVSNDGLQAPEELELKTGLRDLPKVKKMLLESGRRVEVAQKQVDDNQTAIKQLIEANRQLNTQLAMIGTTQVTLNNKLLAAINANKAHIALQQQRGKALSGQLAAARTEAQETRKSFLDAAMKLRSLVVNIVSTYEESAKDKEIVKAVASLNAAIPGIYILGDSRTLATSIRQLEKLEEQIFSESIPLRSEGGRMYASVAINGKETHEMVVDPGAGITILPLGLAGKCGIQVQASDPNVVLSLADGKKIPGKLVTLKSVQVGRFIAKDAKCAVLGIEALNAKPLLGKSFFEKFIVEIDTKKSTMTLIKIAPEAKTPGP